jgi:hypothetical protein
MLVRSFTQLGHWITNRSGIAYSDHGGQTWVDAPSACRPNTVAFAGDVPDGRLCPTSGFVYAFGTPNGRFGQRRPYEYWTGKDWHRGGSAIAAPIVAGLVGELSLRYDQVIKSWEMMTLDESRGAIVVRLAPQPSGPWGALIPVATAREYPKFYGGFLNPDSNGSDLYFTMSQYDQYDVSMMQATLPATR